jgi:hypothetical protein
LEVCAYLHVILAHVHLMLDAFNFNDQVSCYPLFDNFIQLMILTDQSLSKSHITNIHSELKLTIDQINDLRMFVEIVDYIRYLENILLGKVQEI